MVFLKSPSSGAPAREARGKAGRGVVRRIGPARRWRRLALAGVKLLLGLSLVVNGGFAGEFDEYAVKAAYLYNFAKFVEWPPEAFAQPDAPLLICIAGSNPFGSALDALAGKMVENHPVTVRHSPAASGLEQCHVVFIGRAEQGRIKGLLAKLAQSPVLTVSDNSDFTRAGGMIGLVEADQRIRFNISLTAARQANLKLSSQLLKLATVVE